MRGEMLLIAYGIWVIPISGLPLPQRNPFNAELQQRPGHEKEMRYELQVYPELQLPTTLKSEREQQPHKVQLLQEEVQVSRGEQTEHEAEAKYGRPAPQQQQTKHEQAAENEQEGMQQQRVQRPQGTRQQQQQAQETSKQQEAEQQKEQDQGHQGLRDMAIAVSLVGTGGTAAFSAVQNKQLHSKLHSADMKLQDLQGKHDKLTQELAKLDEEAAKRVTAPPPSTALIECILKEYNLPPNWEELSFLIPAEIWNVEGPQCQGWRPEYRIAFGTNRIITPSRPSKPKPDQTKKPDKTKTADAGKGDGSPVMPSMTTFKAWMTNAAYRLGSISNKITGIAKPTPIWGGFKLRPAMIF